MEQKPRYKEARLASIRLMVRLSEIRTKNKEQRTNKDTRAVGRIIRKVTLTFLTKIEFLLSDITPFLFNLYWEIDFYFPKTLVMCAVKLMVMLDCASDS